MIEGKNPLGNKPRRIGTTFVAVVLIASLLSATISSNGYVMQNVGMFLGLSPASANYASAQTSSVLDNLVQFIGVAYAAKPSGGTNLAANIDQCTNGGVGSPIAPCKIDATYSDWVNGNSNGQKSHWKEAQFISYRVTVTGLDGSATEHTLRIQYDTVHGGKHAIDYLGSFDATETTGASTTSNFNNNNPCLDKLPAAQCNPASPADTFAIPAAALANCGGSAGTAPAQASGSIAIFGAGGDLTGVSYPTNGQNVLAGQGQCSTSVDIKFKSTASTVVIAWGGHIASEAPSSVAAPVSGWGAGNSASFISGSPYHMALVTLDGASTGSQDRALSTSAVIFTPTVTTTIRRNSDDKNVTFDSVANGTVVHDTAALVGAASTAGGSVVYKFYNNSTCTGTPISQETKSVTNSIVENATSVTLTAGFGGTASYCFTATYSGDSKNIGPVTSPIEPITVNPPPAGTITIVKDEVPNLGTDFSFTTSGGLSLSNFVLDDDLGADNSHTNSTSFSNVLAGTYNVTETVTSGYTTTVACVDSTNDSTPGTSTQTNKATIRVTANDIITCTFTNTKLGKITIIKDTQPDDASAFSFASNITGAASFVLDDDGNAGNSNSNTKVISNVALGTYNVTEAANAYGTTVQCTDSNSNPSTNTATRTAIIKVDAGDDITCTFTNTKLSTKITAFGYTNAPTGLPSLNDVSGTTTYKINVTNFGGADTLLNVTLVLGHDIALAGGHINYTGYSGPAGASLSPPANCDTGCSIVWTNLSLAKNAVLTFTVTITYDHVPDGTKITADLDSTFKTILGGANFVRTVNGSHAGIDFTAQVQ